MLLLAVAANAQTGSLDGITSTVTGFTTWLRIIAGVLGVLFIVFGAIAMMASRSIEHGAGRIVAGIVGLLIAGYAQAIVNAFYSTAG